MVNPICGRLAVDSLASIVRLWVNTGNPLTLPNVGGVRK